MRVLVVGGGVAGLSVAHGLVAAGADVTVLERRSGGNAEGSGLSLMPNGLAALQALGLDDTVAGLTGGRAPTGGGIRRPDGRWLRRLSPRAVGGLRVVHRAELHDRLLRALPPHTVWQAAEARLADPEAGTVVVDHVETRADVVVAADGIRSQCRARLGLDPGLRPSGYGAWRGVTTEPVPAVEPCETWGRGQRLGLVPLPDGRVYWFAVERHIGTPPGDPLTHVLEQFGHWHDPIARVVQDTPADSIAWTDIHDLARPLPTYTRGRVVLVGDAAHAMTPDLGQGGNLALEDSATLVALLAPLANGSPRPPQLHRRLGRYDEARRRRTQAIAGASRRLGGIAQASRPLLVAVRDRTVGAVPAAMAEGQMRRLAGWTPPAT